MSSRSTRPLLCMALALFLSAAGHTQAQVSLNKISTDTFTNSSSQHATEVEPDTFSYGNTIVSAYQVGRIFGGGGADIGFSTSTDGGNTWTHGFLPGITTFNGGTFSAVSDASVAYDAAHGVWLINALPISSSNQLSVNRSTDGINWDNPITVSKSGSPDKNWIVCDNYPASAFFGHCYVEWDDTNTGDTLKMNTSTDGGLTWSAALKTAGSDGGIGGQPLVMPNGTVVVAFNGNSGNMMAFTSTNGGTSWNKAVKISTIKEHGVAGGLRTSALPTGEIDGGGMIYIAWQDCRFRTACASNDIVYSTSSNGSTWSGVRRVPIDATSSTVDHFIPGLAVDTNTKGSNAHLALTYYYYPISKCSNSCNLYVGYISSSNAGRTWTASQTLSGAMQLSWLPNTFSGLMVGDYISTSYASGLAHSVFATANAKSGSVFDEAMYTTTAGLAPVDAAEVSAENDRPVPGTHSDIGPRQYWDLEHTKPIPPYLKVGQPN